MYHPTRPIAVIAIFCAASFIVVAFTSQRSSASGQRPFPARKVASTNQFPPAVDAAMAAQAPYMELNQQVYTALGSSVNNLAGTKLDVAGHRFYVYLKGSAPPELLSLVRKASAEGITLEIKRARFSESDLEAAVQKVVAVLPTGAAGPGYSIDLATDGSGLTLNYPADVLPAAASAGIRQVCASSGVPITVKFGVPAPTV